MVHAPCMHVHTVTHPHELLPSVYFCSPRERESFQSHSLKRKIKLRFQCNKLEFPSCRFAPAYWRSPPLIRQEEFVIEEESLHVQAGAESQTVKPLNGFSGSRICLHSQRIIFMTAQCFSVFNTFQRHIYSDALSLFQQVEGIRSLNTAFKISHFFLVF